MNMPETEKIGLTEWLEVHKHSRVVYLKLRPGDVALYDIRPDDQVLVELVAIKRGLREPEAESAVSEVPHITSSPEDLAKKPSQKNADPSPLGPSRKRHGRPRLTQGGCLTD